MNERKKVIVIGSGAGGAMAAFELADTYDVTILEAGKEFHPFSAPLDLFASFRKTGLFLDERMIRLLLPSMQVRKSESMVMVNGIGVGGTTTLATGNAVRSDEALRAMGIDLDEQFARLYDMLPITTDHRRYWNGATEEDRMRLKRGVRQCRHILERMGIPREETFLGILNAGHPGGMLPLTMKTRDSLHDPKLPDNLYVADSTLFPESAGLPPILTIMALALKVTEKIRETL